MTIGRTILAATDFSELGQAAVEHALGLAAALNGRLDVVHVFSSSSASSTTEHREELHHMEQRARAQLDVVAELLRMRGRLGQTLLLYGEAAPMILEAAAQLTVDLIVLGSHGRNGLGRLVMGSTAESVLRESFVPVLVVKRRQGESSQQRFAHALLTSRQASSG